MIIHNTIKLLIIIDTIVTLMFDIDIVCIKMFMILCSYLKTLNLLQRLCEVRNYKFLRLDGSTTVSKRQELVERFNAGYCSESKSLGYLI